MSEDEAYKYWAFISYSHDDEEVCDWLHKGLETYRIPRKLVGQNVGDAHIPKKLFPVFRDREELSSASDLSEHIQAALKASRYLIVLCSPRAAKSFWVNEEIKAFKAMGREDRILCLIADGEPNSSVVDKECFPEAVKFKIGVDGLLTDERTEPIAADAREGKDGRVNAKLKLIAGILAVNFDSLKQRENERQFRFRIAMAFIALFAASLFLGLWQWTKYNEQRNQVMVQYQEIGRRELQNGNPAKALLYFSEVYSMGGDNPSLQLMIERSIQPIKSQLYTIEHSPLSLKGGAINYQEIHSMDISSDSRSMVTVSSDKTAKLWDVRSGESIATLGDKQFEFASAAYSSDDKRIVTGCYDQSLRLWAASDGELISTLKGHNSVVWTTSFSPDDSEIVSVDKDYVVKIWNAKTNELIDSFSFPEIPNNWWVYEVRYQPAAKNRLLAWIGWGQDFEIWDLKNRKRVSKYVGHTSQVTSLDISPDGKHIVTGCWDKTAKIWDLETGKLLNTLEGHLRDITSVNFNANGSSVVTGANDGIIKLWVASTGGLIRSFKGVQSKVNKVMFTPDGTRMAAALSDNTVKMLDPNDESWEMSIQAHKTWVMSANFSSDNKLLVSSGRFDRTAKVWDAKTGALLCRFQGHDGGIWSTAFSSDSTRLITGSEDGTAKIWNARTGDLLLTLEGHLGKIRAVDFAPDATRALTGSYDGTAKVWNAQTADIIFDMQAHEGGVTSVAYSPNGKTFITGGHDKSVKVWDAGTGELLQELKGHQSFVSAVSFSPDSSCLLSASKDGTVKVWNVDSGHLIASLEDHQSYVASASFSPDGDKIVTGSSDKSAKIWNAGSGELIATYEGGLGLVTPASFSADGLSIAVGGSNGTIKIFSVAPNKRSANEVADLVKGYSFWMLKDGKLFPSTPDTAYQIDQRSPRTPGNNDSKYVSMKIPDTVIAGENFDVFVEYRNTGESTWLRRDGYKSGSQEPQDNNIFGVNRAEMKYSAAVASGDTYTFHVRCIAPSTPGEYTFQRRLLQEGVEWFGAMSEKKRITVIAK